MESYTYHDLLAYLGVGGAHPGGLAVTKEILRDLPIKPTDHILDAGCGTGQTAAYLVNTYGCHVTAIDQHPMMVEKARERFSNQKNQVDLLEGNVEAMDLETGSFDFIVVESVTVFTTIRKTVNEYARLLRKGGILLDLEMTAGFPFAKEEIDEFQSLYGIREVPGQAEWMQLFKTAGFHTVAIVKEHTVAEAVNEESFQADAVFDQEIDLSEPLDPVLYEIWFQHQALTQRFADVLKYVVYKAEL
ncbi:class I SAM-dependent methyltransferase [Lentibacillus sp. N15]|uniref:class I SAM-dependent methyltransferase n=1 Tax=Lentibacillus songyuanensis TaxID=3136161 RepID=UPI0031BA4E78